MSKTATYECPEGHKWTAEIEGGILPLKHDKIHPSECPACGSIYFKWTNHQEFER